MVDKIKPAVLAVIVGCTSAFFLFKDVEETISTSEKGKLVAVQIGVFTKNETADELAKSVGGEVFEDSGIFRVYYSILSKDDNIEYIGTYLNERGVSYYLKKIDVKKKVIDDMEVYENAMKKASGEAKLKVNDEILKKYVEVL